jgi:two-component system phosphate regulon sensor histidine kinase PhoR
MWRSRLFWRLFINTGLLAGLAAGVLGYVGMFRMQQSELAEQEAVLRERAGVIRELLLRTDDRDMLRARVEQLAQVSDCRILLLGADGTVQASSSADSPAAATALQRPEIRQAEVSGRGLTIRYGQSPVMELAERVDGLGPVRFIHLTSPLDDVIAEWRTWRWMTIAAIAAAVLGALGMSLWLARRWRRPLVELTRAARSFPQRPCPPPVGVTTHDEIGTLAAAFNEMTQACSTALSHADEERHQLRSIFDGMVEGVVVIDAEQRVVFLNDAAGRLLNTSVEAAAGKKLWQLRRHRQLTDAAEQLLTGGCTGIELEWSNSETQVLAVHGAPLPGTPIRGAVLVLHDITSLRRLERMRHDFAANVSHELKTPLAAIKATVETLLDGAIADPEHSVQFLNRVHENAERLHSLVHDLLTLSRIESGEEKLDIQAISVQRAVEACRLRHEHRALSKQLRLESVPPDEPVAALADEEALAQILDNLVDNAIKYTPGGGVISLRCRRAGESAVIEVEDTGVGIPAKDLGRIFERFYRVDKARSRELGGTGLGLSIVKHLVQSLGGTVTAASQLNSGSMFTVRLPRADHPAVENP